MDDSTMIYPGGPDGRVLPYKPNPAAALHASCSMSSCSICLDALQSPYSLPCGHVFCYQCLVQTIQSVVPHTTQHQCPTCRSLYSIVNISTSFVPQHLRPFITPSVRKLYLNECTHAAASSQASTSASTTPHSEHAAQLATENASLKTMCATWRKRAEMHASATLGLLGLAKMARNHSLELQRENEDLRAKYNALQRKFEHISGDDDGDNVDSLEQLPPLDDDELPSSSLLLQIDAKSLADAAPRSQQSEQETAVGLKRRHRTPDDEDPSVVDPHPTKRTRLSTASVSDLPAAVIEPSTSNDRPPC